MSRSVLGIEESLARGLARVGRFYPLRRGQGRLIQTKSLKRLSRALPEEITTTTRSGVRLRVAPRDYLGRMIYFFGEHEPANADVLAFLLNGKRVFWDVGANYGLFTLEMARRFPQLKILSIEPQPRLQRMISESCALNSTANVVIHPGAVGDHEGTMTLHIPEGSMAVASLTIRHAHASKLQVPVVTLDGLSEKYEPPDVIKLDVEGAELAAIRGGRRLFSEMGPAVLMEANEARMRPLGESLAVQELAGMGYRFFNASGQVDSPCSLDEPLRRGHDIVGLKDRTIG